MDNLSNRLRYYLRTKLTGFQNEFEPNSSYNLTTLQETKAKVEKFLAKVEKEPETNDELLEDIFPENKFFIYLNDPLDIKKHFVGVHVNTIFNRQILVDLFNFKAPKNFKIKRRTKFLPPLKYQGQTYDISEQIHGYELYEILEKVGKESELIAHGYDIRKEQNDNVILSIPKHLFQDFSPEEDEYISIYNRYICVPIFMNIVLASAITTEAIYSNYSDPISELSNIVHTYTPFNSEIQSLEKKLSTYIEVFDSLQQENSFFNSPNKEHKFQIEKCRVTLSNIYYLLSDKHKSACKTLSLNEEISPELMSIYLEEKIANFKNWQHLSSNEFQELVEASPFQLPSFFNNYIFLLSEIKSKSSFQNLSQIFSQLEDEAEKITAWTEQIPTFLKLAKEITEVSLIQKEQNFISKILKDFESQINKSEQNQKLKKENRLAEIQSDFLEELERVLPNWNNQFDSNLMKEIKKTNYKKVPKLKTANKTSYTLPSLSSFQEQLSQFFLDKINIKNLKEANPILPDSYEEFQNIDWEEKLKHGGLCTRNFIYFYHVFYSLFTEEQKHYLYNQIIEKIKQSSECEKTTSISKPTEKPKNIQVYGLTLDTNNPLNHREIKSFLDALDAKFVPGMDGHDSYRIQIDENTSYTYTISVSTVKENKYHSSFLLKDLRLQSDGKKRFISKEFYNKLKSAFEKINLTLSYPEPPL